MKLYFSDQPLPKVKTKAIFLAGPSPRSEKITDWRHLALTHIKEIGFNGEVLIPIPENIFLGLQEDQLWSYENQVDWECKARSIADKIVFWIPRDIQGGLPGFTTNFEFGEDLSSGKILYGRPNNADKCSYIDSRYGTLKQPIFNDLKYLLQHASEQLGEGSYREAGEVHIPLFIWNTEQFQLWYLNLKESGNKLIDAKLLQHTNVDKYGVFSFVMAVNIWVEKEKRFKSNEFIFSRKDTSSVMAYFQNKNDTFIVFVKEFRSPVNNSIGFVLELPSGSSAKNIDPKTNAQHELFEETGLLIQNVDRFEHVSTRQLIANLSTHQNHLFKIKLEQEEFNFLLKTQSILEQLGEKNDSEITYVFVINEKDIYKHKIDYSNLGMVYNSLHNINNT